jgi:hypothetical protein
MPVDEQNHPNGGYQTPSPNSAECPGKLRDWLGIGQSTPHIHPAAFPFVVDTSVARAEKKRQICK